MTQALLLIHSKSESAKHTNLQRRKQSAEKIAQSPLPVGAVQLRDIDGRKVSVAAKLQEVEQMRSDSYWVATTLGRMAWWQAATRYVQEFALPSHLPRDMQRIGEPDLTIAPGELWLYVGSQFGPQPVVIWRVYRIAKGGLQPNAVLPLCDAHTLQVRFFQATTDGLQWQDSGFWLVHRAPLCVHVRW